MDYKDKKIELLEKLIPFMRHNPVCQIMQNWDETFQAMNDVPNIYRDEDYHEAYRELQIKSNTCTCGLDSLRDELASLPQKENEVTNKMIEKWAALQENPWAMVAYRRGLVQGAKAMRDGKIK